MAKLYLTIPVTSEVQQTVVTPDTLCMGMRPSEIAPELLYGFYGRNQSKGQPLNAAFARANKDDAVVTGRAFFYLVDLMFETPDPALGLQGQLQSGMLDKVPFLVTKRITSECSAELGVFWYDWAVDVYGRDAVSRSAKTNWDDYMSFAPRFPLAAKHLFNQFPNLRCAILPMNVRTDLEARTTSMTWVGVTLQSEASQWVADASARMHPNIRVNLKPQ